MIATTGKAINNEVAVPDTVLVQNGVPFITLLTKVYVRSVVNAGVTILAVPVAPKSTVWVAPKPSV